MFREHALEDASPRLTMSAGPDHGPPLLLLHGVLRNRRDFLPLLGPLAPRWQLRGLDFRGHGQSAAASAYRVVDYVEDAGRALQSLENPAVIYGHSLGAMVALAAAARFPRHVAGLVLEDPPFETMGASIRATAFHSLFLGMRDALRAAANEAGGREAAESGPKVPDLARRLAEIRVVDPDTGGQTRLGDVRDAASLRFSAHCLARVDPAVLEPIVAAEWMEGYDLARILPRVTCPCLVLQADLAAGGMLTPDNARRLETELEDAVRVEFPGVGHLIHWQDTPRLLAVVGNFLETLRA